MNSGKRKQAVGTFSVFDIEVEIVPQSETEMCQNSRTIKEIIGNALYGSTAKNK